MGMLAVVLAQKRSKTWASVRVFGRSGPSGRARRGFTLIELMITVVIMGVLSALAVVGYRRYVNESKTSEAREIIGSIKAGQESFLDETFQYLNVSGNADTYYPSTTPTGEKKTMWGQADPGFAALGVTPAAPVYFGYSTIARNGGAGPALNAGLGVTGFGAIPTSNQPQYLVKAVCDIAPGGAVTAYVSSSIQADIYGENVGQ
jgi:type IV pilus assembly protein PilA